MAEKMTAVWLILLTIIVCAAVPAAMIWLTSQPKPELVLGIKTPDVPMLGIFSWL
jgi:hypothetical protein